MKKMLFIFIILFFQASFCIDCSNIESKDFASTIINYSVKGVVELNFDDYLFENFSFNFRGVPQIVLQNYDSEGIILIDDFGNKMINFELDEISENLNWHFNSILSISNDEIKIRNNPPFPYLNEFDESIKKYLDFSKTANKDINIKLKTNQLVAGVNDYLTAVAIISEFVSYYIEYNKAFFLYTSANASEVFNIKKGVCDEYSTLAISMFRSVGIPARYVGGYAFTNIGDLGCMNFEPHSWIEIYVPNHGWIQVDNTFKEFFWINSGHIPLYSSPDLLDILSLQLQRKAIGEESANFLKKNEYDFNISLLGFEKNDSILLMDISAPSLIGDDSYFLINVSITNPSNYWILNTLVSTPIKDIGLINNNHSIPLVIPPNEQIIKQFIFKSPILVCEQDCYSDARFRFSLGGGKSETSIVRIDTREIKNHDLNSLLNLISSSDRIISSELLVNNIKFNREKFLNQNPVISFDLKNIGNALIPLNILINYDNIKYVEKQNILINEEINYMKQLELPFNKGKIPVNISFQTNNLDLNYETFFIILKEPEYEISAIFYDDYSFSIELPESADFKQGTMSIYLNNDLISEQSMEKNNLIIIDKNLFKNNNNLVKFVLDYEDEQFFYFKIIEIDYLVELSLIEQITRFFESFFKIILFLIQA